MPNQYVTIRLSQSKKLTLSVHRDEITGLFYKAIHLNLKDYRLGTLPENGSDVTPRPTQFPLGTPVTIYKSKHGDKYCQAPTRHMGYLGKVVTILNKVRWSGLLPEAKDLNDLPSDLRELFPGKKQPYEIYVGNKSDMKVYFVVGDKIIAEFDHQKEQLTHPENFRLGAFNTPSVNGRNLRPTTWQMGWQVVRYHRDLTDDIRQPPTELTQMCGEIRGICTGHSLLVQKRNDAPSVPLPDLERMMDD